MPQVSVRLREVPKEHFERVRFYTRYWNENRSVLLDGSFKAHSMLANYPFLLGASSSKIIVSLYGKDVVSLEKDIVRPALDVIHGRNFRQVVLSSAGDFGRYRYVIRNVWGEVTAQGEVELRQEVKEFTVLVFGILWLGQGQAFRSSQFTTCYRQCL